MSQDPLNFNLEMNDVETEYPTILPGSYILKIKEAEILPNKDETGHNLRVRFATTAPATSLKGQEQNTVDDVPPGFVMTRYLSLQGSKKNPDYDFRKGIAELLDAAFKCEKGARPDFNPETVAALVGKELVATVKVRTQSEGEYAGQVSNDVARVRALN
jgi:hypothetical protein